MIQDSSPQPTNDETTLDLCAALECLLFLAEEPLPEGELARLLEVTPAKAKEIAETLQQRFAGRGLQPVKVAGGWRLCTRPEYADFIARLHEPAKIRLSRPALETLAIIAYRQPITRPEIEAVRGVNVDGVITTLLSYNLVEERGRKEAPGRPMQYGTSTDFLSHFGLDKVEDLPPLPEAQAEEVAKQLALDQGESEAPAQAPPPREEGLETPEAEVPETSPELTDTN
jgi:segregation and condensation protein B